MIFNAKDRPLFENSGTLPDMSGALDGWLQKMPITRTVKTVNEFFAVVETPTTYNYEGVWQPFTFQQLEMKPEGQRQWKWFTLHTKIGIGLIPDEIVTYLGVQYRVMGKGDFNLYGYFEYQLIQDYTGSGPA